MHAVLRILRRNTAISSMRQGMPCTSNPVLTQLPYTAWMHLPGVQRRELQHEPTHQIFKSYVHIFCSTSPRAKYKSHMYTCPAAVPMQRLNISAASGLYVAASQRTRALMYQVDVQLYRHQASDSRACSTTQQWGPNTARAATKFVTTPCDKQLGSRMPGHPNSSVGGCDAGTCAGHAPCRGATRQRACCGPTCAANALATARSHVSPSTTSLNRSLGCNTNTTRSSATLPCSPAGP